MNSLLCSRHRRRPGQQQLDGWQWKAVVGASEESYTRVPTSGSNSDYSLMRSALLSAFAFHPDRKGTITARDIV
jgi:hypothetical protein